MTFDIAIVGGGVVGATFVALLADELRLSHSASEKLSIALIDAGEFTPNPDLNEFDSRVVALTKRSKHILFRAKAWSYIVNTRACPYQRMHVWDAEGTGNIEFDAAANAEEELGYICENKVVTSSLYRRLNHIIERPEEEPGSKITLIEHEKLTSIDEPMHDESSELHFESGRSINAKLIIAADGAQSKVRSLIGINTREWSYNQTAIVTTVKTEKSHEFCAWQRFSNIGPLAFLPLSRTGEDSFYSSIVWSIQSEEAYRMMQIDNECFKEKLAAALEFRLGRIVEIDKRTAIPLRQRSALAYYKRNCVLIGDAAHSIHPLAGQGVNLGLYDVKVLVDEICRALNRGINISNQATLRRYERKRRPHNLVMMSGMELFKRGFSSDQLMLRWLRNEGLNFVDRHYLLKKFFSYTAAGNVADL